MSYIIWLEMAVSFINIHIILTRVLPGALKKRAIIMSGVVLPCLVASIFKGTLLGELAVYLGFSLIIVIPMFTVENIHLTQKLYISVFYLGFSFALMIPFIWIADAIRVDQIHRYIIDILINLLLLTVFVLISRRIIFPTLSFQVQLIPRRLKIILLISVWFSALLAYMLSQLFYDYSYIPNILVIEILSASLILLVGLLCPWLVISIISVVHYKSMLCNVENQVQAQVKHYETLARADQEIRTFKHDFKNLGISLAKSLSDHDTAEAYRCLQKFNKSFEIKHIVFETGNSIADALLSEKQKKALAINASIVFNGHLPNGYIPPIDLCVILGNALDNAIEACTVFPDEIIRQITIDSTLQNNFLFITFQNPVLHDIHIHGNVIPTTKKDISSHGIGLYSIQNTVHKYNGNMSLSCQNCIFSLELTLDINETDTLNDRNHQTSGP